MRIACPYCGERGNNEFVYQGDASVMRPEPRLDDAAESAASPEWMAYTYMRANPAGPHREYWLHAHGCRALLIVTRDTTNHVILAVEQTGAATHRASP